MFVGTKIYYNSITNEIIYFIDERQGNVRETSIEEDSLLCPEILNENIDIFHIPFGEKPEGFADAKERKIINNELVIIPYTEEEKEQIRLAFIAQFENGE